MVKNWIIRKIAMFLLRNAERVGNINNAIEVKLNKGDLEKDYWQQSFIEFFVNNKYSIRYFPRRFIRDYTINGKPHKTYFDGWYTFSNGEYSIYQAKDADIESCKQVLKQIRLSR